MGVVQERSMQDHLLAELWVARYRATYCATKLWCFSGMGIVKWELKAVVPVAALMSR